MTEVQIAWGHVERELGKRYPEIQRVLQYLPHRVEDVPAKAVAQELYRLARDISELNHQASKYKRLSRLL